MTLAAKNNEKQNDQMMAADFRAFYGELQKRGHPRWGGVEANAGMAGAAILDRFLHHAQTIAITGRSYRLKDHAVVAGKEDKNKKTKSKSNESSAAEPAS